MSERTYNIAKGYRYGFNGKEKDDEVSGDGNQYDYGFRIYNPRLGKFLSIDPEFKIYADHSTFASFGNNPIFLKDIDGDKIYIYYEVKGKDGKTTTIAYEYGSKLKPPRDKFVRQTIRTLKKIERTGKDPNGIISEISKSTTANAGILKRDSWDKVNATVQVSQGTYKMGDDGDVKKMEGNEPDIILWHPQSGYISKDGKIKQSAANGLMHELGHVYYDNFDPEGCMEEFNSILKLPSDKQSEALNKFNKEEQAIVGEFDTYSDRWIILNVESKFGEGVRNTHRGNILKTIFGSFSKIGTKYATSGGEKGQTKNLKK